MVTVKGLSDEMKLRNESLAVGSVSLAIGMAVIMCALEKVRPGCWSGIDWTGSQGVLIWSYIQSVTPRKANIASGRRHFFQKETHRPTAVFSGANC